MELRIEELSEEQQRIAEAIGVEAYLTLAKRFGGTSLYIAKAEEILQRKSRDERIRNEFNGNNHSQLATKYGLTEVWIRTIVYDKTERIKRKPIEGQLKLTDFLYF